MSTGADKVMRLAHRRCPATPNISGDTPSRRPVSPPMALNARAACKPTLLGSKEVACKSTRARLSWCTSLAQISMIWARARSSGNGGTKSSTAITNSRGTVCQSAALRNSARGASSRRRRLTAPPHAMSAFARSNAAKLWARRWTRRSASLRNPSASSLSTTAVSAPLEFAVTATTGFEQTAMMRSRCWSSNLWAMTSSISANSSSGSPSASTSLTYSSTIVNIWSNSGWLDVHGRMRTNMPTTCARTS
mmetsp:Transcript_71379/g.206677  ORF Transcript_71379/g.206677 Transcript_71379/m.206677 type:complete len:249 (+) Transcript_71379:408-1154(+)